MKEKLYKPLIALLAIIHFCGAIGLLSNFTKEFNGLTPVTLLIMFLITVFYFEEKGKTFWTFVSLAFGIGLLSEILGVKTGFPFGDYNYSSVLGPKIGEVPFIIGINWCLLVMLVGVFINGFPITKTFKILSAALFMLLIDFLMEPIAIHFNWWQWKAGVPNFLNYAGWFGVSTANFIIFYNLPFNKKCEVAQPILMIFFAFIFTLSLFI